MDKLLHKIMSESYRIVFHRINGVPVPYYYAESKLYAFKLENGLALSIGDNPQDAWERLVEVKHV